jgi:hypothetical protein
MALTKGDFFKNFYLAYNRAFTKANINSGWQKTGLEPFSPEQVLKIFEKAEVEQTQVSQARAWLSLGSCLGV